MNRSLYDRANALFEALCDEPTNVQAERLDELCDGDEALRSAVEEMLAADQDSSLFLDHTAGDGVAMVLARDMASSAAVADPSPEQSPESVGPYRIVRKLGSGGMGVVYEAEQAHPRRRVALKCIHEALHTDILREQFRVEAQAMGQLLHPGIPQIYEAGEDNGQLYLVMELVEGEPLPQFLRRSDPTRDRRIRLLIKLCDATHHAHARGVVHRDLKPGNIFVTTGRQPKILDFGIATATRQQGLRDAPWIGTPGYMCPEQLCNSADVDARGDVYALGVIAYEVLTGRRAFRATGASFEQMIAAARTGPPPLKLGGDLVSHDLEAIVGRAMAHDRDDRYATAADMAHDLRCTARDEPIQAIPSTLRYRVAKWKARNRATLRTAFSVLLLVVLVAAGFGLAREAARRWRQDQTESAATQGLAAMRTQITQHLASGDIEGADAVFHGFAHSAAIRGTRALTWAWLERAVNLRDRERADEELDALSIAYASAPTDDLRDESLLRLARAFRERWHWSALAVVLDSLGRNANRDHALDELRVAAHLGRGDFEAAADLLTDDPASIGPLLRALTDATPTTLDADEVLPIDIDGDGHDELIIWNYADRSIHVARTTADLQPAVALVQPRGIGAPERVYVIPGRPARLAVTYSTSDGVFRIYPVTPANLRGDPLVAEATIPSPSTHTFCAVDLDGDGLEEVYTGGEFPERGMLRLDRDEATGTWTRSVPHPPTNRIDSDIGIIIAVDLDEDGRDELLVGASQWLAYSVRAYRPGPNRTLELIDQVRLGRVPWIRRFHLATGESGAVVYATTHDSNPTLFGEGETQFVEPGIYFIDMIHHGDLTARWLAPLPAPYAATDPYYWNLHVGDFDDDGLEDMALGTFRGPSLLLRQRPDATFASAVVKGRALLSVDVDDDRAEELILRGSSPERRIWVLGAGNRRLSSAETGSPRAAPRAHRSLGSDWNRAKDLVAMGLWGQAARLAEEQSALATDPAEEARALTWAAGLYESLGAHRDAARLYRHALRDVPRSLESTWGEARTLARLHRYDEALDAYERLDAHPDASAVMKREAEGALAQLRSATGPAPRYELDLGRALQPPWRIHQPMSVRYVPGREDLMLHALSIDRSVATLPMTATGPRFSFEITLEIGPVDIPSYIAMGIRPVGGDDTDGIGISVSIWGGGNQARRRIDWFAPGRDYFEGTASDVPIARQGYRETIRVRVTHVPGIGSRVEMRDGNDELQLEASSAGAGDPPVPRSEYELVIGVPDNQTDNPMQLTARIESLAVEGFSVGTGASDAAALALVNGDPSRAIAQLGDDVAILRAHALADLGQLDAAAAIAEGIAAIAPSEVASLLRLTDPTLVAPLHRRLGDAFYELYDHACGRQLQADPPSVVWNALSTPPFSPIPGITPAQRRLLLYRAAAAWDRGLIAQAKADLERLTHHASDEETETLRHADLLLARIATADGELDSAARHVRRYRDRSPDADLACQYIQRQPSLAAIPCSPSAD